MALFCLVGIGNNMYIVKTKMTSRNKLVVMASYDRDEQVPYRKPPDWCEGTTACDNGIISKADGSCRKWSVYFSTDLDNFTVAPDEEQHVYFQLESAEIRFASLGEPLSLVRYDDFQEDPSYIDTLPNGKQYYVLFDGEGSDIHMNTWDGRGRMCWKDKNRLRILEDVKTGDVYSMWYSSPGTDCRGYNNNKDHRMTPFSTYSGLMDMVLHAIKYYKLTDYLHEFNRDKE